MVGKNLSHYKILAELGRGGMGIVYKAEDTKLDRKVAIKVLPSAALASEDDRARFYREAKAAAQLHHQHIASVFEIDEAVPEGSKDDDLRPFIAMEFIEGQSLDAKIKEGPFKLEDAVRIASEIASALEAAHKKDIVHRDIKSQNVMLTEEGSAKVLDFGLAQTAASTKLTRMGSTMGTIAYMSPEQASGEKVDTRTDLWSLGVVLYEMISGIVPFPGDYEQAVLYEILNQDPEPLTAVRTGVPMELERITNKCLAKGASSRYQHAVDLIVDLAAVEYQSVSAASQSRHSIKQSTGVPRTERSSKEPADIKRSTVAAAVIGSIIITALASWLLMRGGGQADFQRVQTITRVTTESMIEMNPSFHPLGDRIVYAAGKMFNMQIYSRRIDGGNQIRLVPDSFIDQQFPSYSPDGRLVLFESDGSIYTVDALGGVPRPEILRRDENSEYLFPTWSPSGDAIAFTDQDSIYVLDLPQRVQRLSVATERAHSLSWSPDGSYIAYVRLNVSHARRASNIAPSSIRILDVRDGSQYRVTEDEHMDLSPKWNPDGSMLYFVSDREGRVDIYRQRVSERLSVEDSVAVVPQRITTGLSLHSFDLSDDGKKIIASELTYRQNIWASQLSTDQVSDFVDAKPITSGQQVIEGIAFSSDGSRIAYDSNVRGLSHIFVMPLPEGAPRQVTSREDPDFLFDWSPYSGEFAFHTFHDGSRDIGIVSENGLEFKIIEDGPDQTIWPFWMGPNTLAFQQFNTELNDDALYITERDDSGGWSQPELILDNILAGATWSSAREQVAYIAENALFVWDPITGESSYLFSDDILDGYEFYVSDSSPTIWSEDGNTIYIKLKDDTGNQSFWGHSLEDNSTRMVLDLTGAFVPQGVQAIHDNQIYYTVSEIEGDLWALDLIE